MGQLTLVIVGDEEMRQLHHRFLGEDEPTDVLSFPGEGESLGEVVLSYDRAGAQAEEHGVPREEEVARLTVHGLLHLAGYDDRSEPERERMWARQEELLERHWLNYRTG